MVTQCEERVNNHTQFTEWHQSATEWLKTMNDRLLVYGVTLGDKHAVHNRLERLQVSTK